MTRLLFGTVLCIGIFASLGFNSPVSLEYVMAHSANQYEEGGSPVKFMPESPLSFSQNGQQSAVITLPDHGTALFESISAQNIDRRLAIVMDNKVLMAPVVQQKISGGKLVLMGKFIIEEASDLGLAMHTSSLPHPFTMLESRIIAPAVGKGVGS